MKEGPKMAEKSAIWQKSSGEGWYKALFRHKKAALKRRGLGNPHQDWVRERNAPEWLIEGRRKHPGGAEGRRLKAGIQ